MATGIRAFFKKRPLISNCISYGVLYMGAELSQQTLLRKVLPEKQQDFDLATVGRYGVLGSTVFPTLMFYWYKLLGGFHLHLFLFDYQLFSWFNILEFLFVTFHNQFKMFWCGVLLKMRDIF